MEAYPENFIFDNEIDGAYEQKKKPSVKEMWAQPVLKSNLVAASVMYAVACFNFYMLTFYLKYFPGNIF